MNSQNIEKKIAEKLGISEAKAKEIFKAVLEANQETIGEMSVGDKMVIRGLGTFKVIHQEGRNGRNPATGGTVWIPAKNVVKFKASKQLQDVVN